uniref:AT3G52170-like helix-turn-helix domain-containing protein n=1 Tax=Oryza punctata TaxID=4537 RepID=A0A0E0MN39_ORYPU
MQATGSGSWVAQASVLGCGGGGVVLRRPSWDGGAAVGRVKGFGVVRCCVQEKRPRVRKTKEERREMVESFVNTYRVSNDGKFPSVNLTHKEVGGSYYIVREIVRDIIQENRVLGPGGLNATALSFEDCPDSVESPVTHVLGQDSVEILDMSDDDQAGMDTMTDMSTQQLLGSSNLLDACILNDAVQNGNMADMSCLETNSEKQDEVPCAQSTEIDPSSSEKQAPSFSHAPDLESEFEMDSLEHETQPESVMSNNVQIVDGQSNYTMDTFKSNTNYPETEGTTKSIEVSGVQMLQDQFEQSTTVTDPDEGERAESAISHPELDTKVLPHIEGKNSMVEEDDKELKQSISVVTKEEHDGKKTGKVQPKKETNLFWLIIRAFVVAMSKMWAK